MPSTPSTTEPDSADALGDTDAARVLSGGMWGSVAALVPPLQTFVISIVAARFLGKDGFGEQSLIAFVSLSCGTIFAARMPAALQRFGAQLLGGGQLGVLHWLFRWTWRVQVATAIVIVAGFAVAAGIFAEPRLAWIAAGVGTALGVLQSALASLLVAAQRWRDSILPGTITTIAATVVMVVVLAEGGGVSGYFVVEVGLFAANLAWTWWLVAPRLRELPPPTPISPELRADFRSFVRTSAFFALIEFVVLSRVEVLFLDHFATLAQVGFYSVAYAAAAAVARIPLVITTVAIPAVANLHGAGEHERVRNGYWRALRLLAAICPTLVALAATLGADLLGLVYGAQFRPAETVLAILLVPYLVLPMMGLSDALLWTLRRMRFLVVCGTLGVVVDIVLAFVLIPMLHAAGAAIVNDAALLVAGAPSLWLVARLMAPSSLDWAIIARSVLVAVLSAVASAAPIVAIGGIGGFAAGLVAGGIVATVAALWIGLFGSSDALWLSGVLGDRLGGRLATVVQRLAV